LLRDADKEYLAANGYVYATYEDGGLTLLVIQGYGLPAGYSPASVDLLIQIPPGYPDAGLDMWWVFPSLTFSATGGEAGGAQVRQAFAGYTPEPGRQWQRYSRHPSWRVGIDELRTYLATIRSTFEREVPKAA
jgi:hypothetical protein